MCVHQIYLAAPFELQAQVREYARELEELGYTITAKWLFQKPSFSLPGGMTVLSPETWKKCQEFASRDIQNVLEADTLVLFCTGQQLFRNTRLSEFGGALFTNRQCIIIGPEEEEKKELIDQIFTHFRKVPLALEGKVKPVVHYQHWTDFIKDISNPIKIDICAGCGTDYRKRDCGCPAGSDYIWKNRLDNFEVLPSTHIPDATGF